VSIFLLRGEKELAIAALQEAYDRGWRQSWLLTLDARLDPLRNEPGFLKIERQINEDIAKARAEVLAQKMVGL